MPPALLRRIVICLLVAAPALAIRFTGIHVPPVAAMLIFGAAVVAASFLLAWAAEAAQKDISGALAVALLALIAVLPEYAVDLFYAFRAGSDPAYEQFAAANMTGSNRLLLGFGWPLVVLIAIAVATAAERRRHMKVAGRAARDFSGASTGTGGRTASRRGRSLELPASARLDIGFLAILAVFAFAIPLMRSIPIWFGVVLIVMFGLYLWRAGSTEDDDEEEFVGAAALIAGMAKRPRRITVISMFVGAATIILLSAEPFAEALVESGSALGISSYVLVQWLAPLASEAPEFIIAVLFALRGRGALALVTLIASKINQWSLLVGSLPIAHALGGGTGGALPLDGRQVEEFVLTATQTLLGVAILLSLRFHRWAAIALLALFAVQFGVTDEAGRYVLSAIHLVLALVLLVRNRHGILPSLRAAVGREPSDRDSVTGRDDDTSGSGTAELSGTVSVAVRPRTEASAADDSGVDRGAADATRPAERGPGIESTR
ncbi:MAG: sodium:proton exchanger [Mycetocola sp.]